MPSQNELDKVHMQTAELHARLSKALRNKVGAVLVTSHSVVLTGYNGTPSGCDNNCEYPIYNLVSSHGTEMITKPEVLHAELNCIMKAAKEGVSVLGSTLYTTLSPCVQCSAMLIQAGVKRVVYKEHYRCTKGLDLLRSTGMIVDSYLNSGD